MSEENKTCPHDLAERESACADGLCPLCPHPEVAALLAAIIEAHEVLEVVNDVLDGKGYGRMRSIDETIKRFAALSAKEK